MDHQFSTLQPSQTVLLIVDVQEKLFASVSKGSQILHALSRLVKGFQILHLPIFLSEQYPQGLGHTIAPLQTLLGNAYQPWVKSTFSCLDDPKIFEKVALLPYQQWIVVGIEAHVCVLQTAKGLLKAGKEVIVLNDAVTSRFLDHTATSLAEMREMGVRVSCVETILFELLKDSKHPQFKLISQLIKEEMVQS